MPELSRRTMLGVLGAGAVAGGQWQAGAAVVRPAAPVPRTGDNPVVEENRAAGSDQWLGGRAETRGVDPVRPHIRGRVSASSVGPGESIGFHLTSRVPQDCTVAVYRFGCYAGAGARHLVTSGGFPVGPRTGGKAAWTPTVPQEWLSGVFLGVFTSADGCRAFTPFVVREPARRSGLLFVLPFTRTPDRPFPGLGLPEGFVRETSAAGWLEERGYDVTYATEQDVHEGRVDLARYTVVVLAGTGRDVRWSRRTRVAVERAKRAGTELVHLPQPLALHEPEYLDEEVRRATADLLDRALGTGARQQRQKPASAPTQLVSARSS
ncbi:N,N-dimethylformamidase beta subunit family domain-containing protein [Streptomyces nitrosporeus]|nr:N,N-dimethylformamidase beta subunit family domain-containing protein [Streptomyces nitrosporeus]GGY84515.1 hypothetical protein GCM10010327_13510 [Streptomyces nitrosporeus]